MSYYNIITLTAKNMVDNDKKARRYSALKYFIENDSDI